MALNPNDALGTYHDHMRGRMVREEPALNHSFKPGEVVTLKSHPTVWMTVERTFTQDLDLVWFDKNGQVHRTSLNATLLNPVKA